MPSSTPFTFGIPLMPRATAGDWRLVETLLGLTLASVRAQTDAAFRVIVAGQDRPRALPKDGRFAFLQGNWPVEAPESRNRDGGRKKYAIRQAVLEQGGGLLMFLDADDWIDRRLVEAARSAIGPDVAGGYIPTGLAVDFRTLRAAPLPHDDIFEGGFDRVCGSSIVVRLRPDDQDPFRRDPWSAVASHHDWRESVRRHGAGAARLPVAGAYLIGTSENHSELHGPFAEWRQDFTKAVDRHGSHLDAALARQFGLRLVDFETASQRFRSGSGASAATASRSPGAGVSGFG